MFLRKFGKTMNQFAATGLPLINPPFLINGIITYSMVKSVHSFSQYILPVWTVQSIDVAMQLQIVIG